MSTDFERLVVQLSADLRGYENQMKRAVGVTNQRAREIERRYKAMSGSISRAVSVPLAGLTAGIGGALSVREVLRYADAWTSAKNSLAVAGVIGANQADVMDRLYRSAQANAAPIGALADLFGKAAQASDNLGASQEELLRFSAGVATSLRVAGSSATQASGALTQLGQLLGQARVQAEEFNSINEGARPILMAVAHGLDGAAGSVSKLKQMVTDGEVSGQKFFQAFLRGLPQIEGMAANATQTIEQGVTKVNNAFTKYIGETDESLGASQRLVAALNALADNFDTVADSTLAVAGVIAGALVGRSLTGMIAKLGLASVAAVRFAASIRAVVAAGSVSAAIGGISAAAGPLGLVLPLIAYNALSRSHARTLDGRAWRGLVDGVVGGVPCQPHSVAGKRLGRDDERDLWSAARRIIVQSGAWWVLIENVEGMLSSGGAERVWRDLGRLGFECEVGLFSAEEVGAPHGRERVFILAVADAARGGQRRKSHPGVGPIRPDRRGPPLADPSGGGHDRDASSAGRVAERGTAPAGAGGCTGGAPMGDTPSFGRREGRPEPGVRGGGRAAGGAELPLFPPGPADLAGWQRALDADPSLEPALRGVADGLAPRVDQLRMLGNGVVPLQAAHAIRTLGAALASRGAPGADELLRRGARKTSRSRLGSSRPEVPAPSRKEPPNEPPDP